MAACDGLETLCDIAVPLGEGTGIIAAGVGLVDGQPGIINIDVPGDVVQVLVFWEGFNASNAETPDNQITVGTETITGDLVGPQHWFFSDNYTSVHRADITSYGLVVSGPNAISVGGMDFSKKNNGVGMLVIYDNGGPTADIGVKEGADAAFHAFDPPLDTTVPQTFMFDPESTERTGTLYVFASSVAEGRPTVIEVTTGGSVQRFIDELADHDGPRFDSHKIAVTIPAGASSLTVQVLSEKDPASQFVDPRPASLVWLASGLSVPGIAGPMGCRVTGGMDQKSDDVETINTYSGSGQAGAPTGAQPQPWGEWSHTNHKGPDGHFVFHAGTASAPEGTEIDWIECMDAGWCVQARHAPAKQIDFAGIGSFRNANPSAKQVIQDAARDKSLHWFEVNIDDLGEPGHDGKQQPADPESCEDEGYGRRGGAEFANCDCADFYRIRIHATDDPGSAVIYEVSGYIPKGNFQIHPSLDD
jgi:hypothetical protein